MGSISDAAIRERAYTIWEREGRPHGRDFEHWVRAQVELEAEVRGNGAAKPSPAPPRAVAAKPPVAAQKVTAAKTGRGAPPRAGRSKKA